MNESMIRLKSKKDSSDKRLPIKRNLSEIMNFNPTLQTFDFDKQKSKILKLKEYKSSNSILNNISRDKSSSPNKNDSSIEKSINKGRKSKKSFEQNSTLKDNKIFKSVNYKSFDSNEYNSILSVMINEIEERKKCLNTNYNSKEKKPDTKKSMVLGIKAKKNLKDIREVVNDFDESFNSISIDQRKNKKNSVFITSNKNNFKNRDNKDGNSNLDKSTYYKTSNVKKLFTKEKNSSLASEIKHKLKLSQASTYSNSVKPISKKNDSNKFKKEDSFSNASSSSKIKSQTISKSKIKKEKNRFEKEKEKSKLKSLTLEADLSFENNPNIIKTSEDFYLNNFIYQDFKTCYYYRQKGLINGFNKDAYLKDYKISLFQTDNDDLNNVKKVLFKLKNNKKDINSEVKTDHKEYNLLQNIPKKLTFHNIISNVNLKNKMKYLMKEHPLSKHLSYLDAKNERTKSKNLYYEKSNDNMLESIHKERDLMFIKEKPEFGDSKNKLNLEPTKLASKKSILNLSGSSLNNLKKSVSFIRKQSESNISVSKFNVNAENLPKAVDISTLKNRWRTFEIKIDPKEILKNKLVISASVLENTDLQKKLIQNELNLILETMNLIKTSIINNGEFENVFKTLSLQNKVYINLNLEKIIGCSVEIGHALLAEFHDHLDKFIVSNPPKAASLTSFEVNFEDGVFLVDSKLFSNIVIYTKGYSDVYSILINNVEGIVLKEKELNTVLYLFKILRKCMSELLYFCINRMNIFSTDIIELDKYLFNNKTINAKIENYDTNKLLKTRERNFKNVLTNAKSIYEDNSNHLKLKNKNYQDLSFINSKLVNNIIKVLPEKIRKKITALRVIDKYDKLKDLDNSY